MGVVIRRKNGMVDARAASSGRRTLGADARAERKTTYQVFFSTSYFLGVEKDIVFRKSSRNSGQKFSISEKNDGEKEVELVCSRSSGNVLKGCCS
jgi:hypothetical protein